MDDLTKIVAGKVLRELIEAGCIEGCYDYRGIPAYQLIDIDQAEKGLDAIKARKLVERAGAETVVHH